MRDPIHITLDSEVVKACSFHRLGKSNWTGVIFTRAGQEYAVEQQSGGWKLKGPRTITANTLEAAIKKLPKGSR